MAISALLAVGIDPDSLPPVQRSDVAERHRAMALDQLEHAVMVLDGIREIFATRPDADRTIDAAMPNLGHALQGADFALGHYRATRDCEGSG